MLAMQHPNSFICRNRPRAAFLPKSGFKERAGFLISGKIRIAFLLNTHEDAVCETADGARRRYLHCHPV